MLYDCKTIGFITYKLKGAAPVGAGPFTTGKAQQMALLH